MSSSRHCTHCTSTSFTRDDDTGQLYCDSCGVTQPYDQFESNLGGITGPQGTYIHIGTAGSGLASKTIEIDSMISNITDGEFGQAWENDY
ncbi:hypothetical protein L195_g052896 [Trifolium pratense]|uniref:Uncharacterized protein n=1 Tax=Trifolium pratense TaxID=57577 RepID=A0A2K3K7M4_TRIPR|nr:hypothetical protein L195_g052896 [Trifolium pratense]